MPERVNTIFPRSSSIFLKQTSFNEMFLISMEFRSTLIWVVEPTGLYVRSCSAPHLRATKYTDLIHS